jgi:two-component system, NtrC family, C4-dicarboxylate transport response regulator DctD
MNTEMRLAISDVLIVDDDRPTRYMLRQFLEMAGYRVHEAGNARDALAQVVDSSPAVVLCDIHMPGGANGLWLAEQIRLQSPTTAVVLITGDEYIPAFESLRSGVLGYVLKPVRREELVSAVDDGMLWGAVERQKSQDPRCAQLAASG